MTPPKPPTQNTLMPDREAFDKWFLDNARAPIDPWHKEFAWSVWQAAQKAPPCAEVVLAEVRKLKEEADAEWKSEENHTRMNKVMGKSMAYHNVILLLEKNRVGG